MSKLAHSNQETMDQIEAQAEDLQEPPSWYCEPCSVEVYASCCPHCGKAEEDEA